MMMNEKKLWKNVSKCQIVLTRSHHQCKDFIKDVNMMTTILKIKKLRRIKSKKNLQIWSWIFERRNWRRLTLNWSWLKNLRSLIWQSCDESIILSDLLFHMFRSKWALKRKWATMTRMMTMTLLSQWSMMWQRCMKMIITFTILISIWTLKMWKFDQSTWRLWMWKTRMTVWKLQQESYWLRHQLWILIVSKHDLTISCIKEKITKRLASVLQLKILTFLKFQKCDMW